MLVLRQDDADKYICNLQRLLRPVTCTNCETILKPTVLARKVASKDHKHKSLECFQYHNSTGLHGNMEGLPW